MIQLLDVSKAYKSGRGEPKVLFNTASIQMPLDCRVAVLGRKRAGKSTLLQMLAGKARPDRGLIITPNDISPVINSGRLLYPQLTGAENVQFIARVYGVEFERLLLAMEALQPGLLDFQRLVRLQLMDSRRALEAAMMTVLPFECYLYDDIGQLEPTLLERCFDAAYQRHASVVFSTADPKLALRFAEFVVVIRGPDLYPFNQVEAAVDFFKNHTSLDKN
jgi:capsular polysaccharide transport system ATP-binding protein